MQDHCKENRKRPNCSKSPKKFCVNTEEDRVETVGRYEMTSKLDFIKYMSTLSESDRKKEEEKINFELARTNECVNIKLNGILRDQFNTMFKIGDQMLPEVAKQENLSLFGEEEFRRNTSVLKDQFEKIKKWKLVNKTIKQRKRLYECRLEKLAYLQGQNLENIKAQIKIEQEGHET